MADNYCQQRQTHNRYGNDFWEMAAPFLALQAGNNFQPRLALTRC